MLFKRENPLMPLDVTSSKTFSYVLIGLVALSLLVGSLALLLKNNAPPPSPEASHIEKEARLKKGISALKSLKGNTLALIKLEGEINSDSSGGNFMEAGSGAPAVRDALDAAAKDDKVKGVLLLINSPGGTVGMSQELNAAVKRVRANKPIVATLLDVAASGGYYTACATDKIVTNKGTLTASIGVIMQAMNLQKLMEEKLGVKSITIKSGKFKDLLNPYRKTNTAEVALLQTIINDSYNDFLNTVLEGRLRSLKSDAEKARRRKLITAVADGRVVTGNQAVATGLADEIGDAYHAKDVLQQLVNERFKYDASTELELVPYESDEDFLQSFFHLPFGEVSQHLNVASILQQLGQGAPSPETVLPLTMRYANQPLWLYQ
jgi:protease-4